MNNRLREAASAMLTSVYQMLNSGEWYCAEDRAEALRAALAEPPVKESLTTHPSIIDSIADHLISDHVALMNENKALRDAAQAVLKAWTGGVHPTMGDALRELSAALAKQTPCEVCGGTGGVRALQNGRYTTHPCPRGCAALTEQDQLRGATEMIDEPVAYMYTYHGPEGWGDRLEFPGARWQGPGYNHMPNNWRETPLYAAPQRREWVGLTDEEIAVIASTPCAVVGSYVHTFARAIEAALKEKNRD